MTAQHAFAIFVLRSWQLGFLRLRFPEKKKAIIDLNVFFFRFQVSLGVHKLETCFIAFPEMLLSTTPEIE